MKIVHPSCFLAAGQRRSAGASAEWGGEYLAYVFAQAQLDPCIVRKAFNWAFDHPKVDVHIPIPLSHHTT